MQRSARARERRRARGSFEGMLFDDCIKEVTMEGESRQETNRVVTETAVLILWGQTLYSRLIKKKRNPTLSLNM